MTEICPACGAHSFNYAYSHDKHPIYIHVDVFMCKTCGILLYDNDLSNPKKLREQIESYKRLSS